MSITLPIRSKQSRLALIMFAGVILIGSLISEIFQKPDLENLSQNLIKSPIEPGIINNIKSISINNTLGEFKVENIQSKWWLVTPRKVYAKETLIREIIKVFSSIEVKNIFPKDQINRNSFSLDQPIYTVEIEGDNKTQSLSFGLINPIDNSTYLESDLHENIFQTSTLSSDLRSLGMTDFINSNIFNFNTENILKVKLTRNKRTVFNINYKEQNWYDSKNKVLSKSKVNEFLVNLLNYKADIIIDRTTEEQNNQISKRIGEHTHIIEFGLKNNSSYRFFISRPIRSLEGMKLERRKFILIQEESTYYPLLVKRQFLNSLNTRERSLR